MALANPHLRLALSHNDTLVHDLHATDLAGRIAQLYEHITVEHLIPVHEETSMMTVEGVVGLPQTARKRGDNYFFVNGRFIKNHYLHHAIKTVFSELIEDRQQPFYALNLDIDPRHIDINIHPTKTEIKFDDERTVYAIIQSTVKKAVAQHHTHRQPAQPEADNSFESRAVLAAPQRQRAGSPPKQRSAVVDDAGAVSQQTANTFTFDGLGRAVQKCQKRGRAAPAPASAAAANPRAPPTPGIV